MVLNFRATALAAAIATAFAAPEALALPTDGAVVSGNVSFSQPNTHTLQVTQGTAKAIVNWQSFSIRAGETVNFVQPSSSSVILNRVLGGQASEIFGRMSANGQVFLVNPNGVYFRPGASVDVGGLVASTLNIRDDDFKAGRYAFFRDGTAGEVVNQGTINAPGGYAALLGPKVSNEGLIVATLGTVALAAGERVKLDMIGDGLISVIVDEAALQAVALNKGTIQADGGRVILTARSADALLDTVLSNTGTIRAASMVERNGEIYLDGGSAGATLLSGSLSTAGTAAGTTGGTVKVLGQYVGLASGASIDASGDAGGGEVLVGGNFQGKGTERNAAATFVAKDAIINANALRTGNGGKVIVWSDGATRFYGNINAKGGLLSGNGGFVEVSGKQHLTFRGYVDTTATHGLMGTLLLDPDLLRIVDGISGSLDGTLGGGTIDFGDGGADESVSIGQINSISNASNIILRANNELRFENTQDIVLGTGGAAGASITFQVGDNGRIGRDATSPVADAGDIRAQDTGSITFLGGLNATIDLKSIDLIADTGAITAAAGAGSTIIIPQISTNGNVQLAAGREIRESNGAQLDVQANNLQITLSDANGLVGARDGIGNPSILNPLVTNVNSMQISTNGVSEVRIDNSGVATIGAVQLSVSPASTVDIKLANGGEKVQLAGNTLKAVVQDGSFNFFASPGNFTIDTLTTTRDGGNWQVTGTGNIGVKAVSTKGNFSLNANGGDVTLQPGGSGLIVGDVVQIAGGNIFDGNGTGVITGATNVVGKTSIDLTGGGAGSTVEGEYHTPSLTQTANGSTYITNLEPGFVNLGTVVADGPFRVYSGGAIIDNNGAATNLTATAATLEAGASIGIGGAGTVIELDVTSLRSNSVGNAAYASAHGLDLRGVNTGGAGSFALQVDAGTVTQSQDIVTPALFVKGGATFELTDSGGLGNNNVGTFSADLTNGNLRYYQKNPLQIGPVGTVLGSFAGIRMTAGTELLLIAPDLDFVNGGINAPNATVALSGGGGGDNLVTQAGANSQIVANKLQLLNNVISGDLISYRLDNAANDINVLAMNAGESTAQVYRDANSFAVGAVSSALTSFANVDGITTPGLQLTLQGTSIDIQKQINIGGGQLNLNATTAVVQSASDASDKITAAALALQGAASFTLTELTNAVQNIRSTNTGAIDLYTTLGLTTFGGGVTTNNAAISLNANSVTIANGSPIDAGTGTVTLLARTGNIFGNGALDLTAGNLDVKSTTGRIINLDTQVAATGTITGQIGSTGGSQITNTGNVAAINMTVASANQDFSIGTAADRLVLSGGVLTTTAPLSASVSFLALSGGVGIGAGQYGTLSVATNGIITQSGAVTASGAVSVSSGGASSSIFLGNAGNDFQGPLSLSGGNVQVTDLNGLTLGTVNASQLTLNTGGALTQTGAATVTGTTTVNAGANPVSLTNAGNNFGGAVSILGGATQITDVNALVLGPGTVASLIANAGGDVTQTGPLMVAGSTSVTTPGAITLTDPANDFVGPVSLAGSNVAIKDANTLLVGTIAASGTASVAAPELQGSGSSISSGGATTLDITKITPDGAILLTSGSLVLHAPAGSYNFASGSQPGQITADSGVRVFAGTRELPAPLVNPAMQAVIGGLQAEAAADAWSGAAPKEGSPGKPLFTTSGDLSISLPACVAESIQGKGC